MSTDFYLMAVFFEQLRNIGTTCEDKLAVGMIVTLLKVPELAPVAVSIKILTGSPLLREDIESPH